MPDIEAYAAATYARALSTKCRGGFVEAPTSDEELYFEFGDRASGAPSSRSTVLRPPRWDGRAFIAGVSNAGWQRAEPYPTFGLFQQESSTLTIRALVTKRTSDFFPTVEIPPHQLRQVQFSRRPAPRYRAGVSLLDIIPDPPMQATYVLKGYYYVDDSTRTEPPTVQVIPELLPHLEFDDNVSRSLTPLNSHGYHEFNIFNRRITQRIIIGNSVTMIGFTIRRKQPGEQYDFYARLERGIGSILEVDTAGNQTEHQTINASVRYDARHTVGEYVRIDGDLSAYQIHSIDEIGRQKWQTLTLRRETV